MLASSSTPRARSVKNGLATSSTTRPIVRLRPARSCRADSLRTKPSSLIEACTRSRVGSGHDLRPVEHVGDRGDGDAGVRGDLTDADRHVHPLLEWTDRQSPVCALERVKPRGYSSRAAARSQARVSPAGEKRRSSRQERRIARIPSSVPGAAPRARAWTSDVAQGGRLGRPGDHRQAERVGGELAQQVVARPAADDVHHVGVLAGQRLRVEQRAPVREGQAVHDAPDDLRRAGRGGQAAARTATRRSGRACRPAAGTPGRPRRRRTAAARPGRPPPSSGSQAAASPSTAGTPAAATGRSRCAGTGRSRRCPPRW